MALQSMPNVGASLHNLGNTCFANSVLQCLTHTVPLATYMLSFEHSRNCRSDKFCMMCAMEIHMSIAFSESGNIMTPYDIIDNLPSIAGHFRPGQQEDAHEFLRYAIDKMQESCTSFDNEFPLCFDRTKDDSTNLMDHIFAGSIKSQLVCQNCQYTSVRFEKFLDLALEINTSRTIYESLKDLVKVETLEGDNAYKCCQCNQLVTAKMRSTIHKSPNVLTLALKRFDIFTGSKLTKNIRYPETLTIAPYTSDHSQPNNYNLYGVLVHRGYTTRAGHYYAFVKAGDQWYWMNDEKVTPCDVKKVLRQEAYLLFYLRAPDEPSIPKVTKCQQRAKTPEKIIVDTKEKDQLDVKNPSICPIQEIVQPLNPLDITFLQEMKPILPKDEVTMKMSTIQQKKDELNAWGNKISTVTNGKRILQNMVTRFPKLTKDNKHQIEKEMSMDRERVLELKKTERLESYQHHLKDLGPVPNVKDLLGRDAAAANRDEAITRSEICKCKLQVGNDMGLATLSDALSASIDYHQRQIDEKHRFCNSCLENVVSQKSSNTLTTKEKKEEKRKEKKTCFKWLRKLICLKSPTSDNIT